MNNIIHRIEDCSQTTLIQQADALAQQKMTRLLWNNIDLLYSEIEVESLGELQELAKYLCYICNRVVILGMQSELTHIVVAKSSDISHLCADEILSTVADDYAGQSYGDNTFAQATFYQYDIIPDLIDSAVQSVIVALPYTY